MRSRLEQPCWKWLNQQEVNPKDGEAKAYCGHEHCFGHKTDECVRFCVICGLGGHNWTGCKTQSVCGTAASELHRIRAHKTAFLNAPRAKSGSRFRNSR